jgi:hypothetical protein
MWPTTPTSPPPPFSAAIPAAAAEIGRPEVHVAVEAVGVTSTADVVPAGALGTEPLAGVSGIEGSALSAAAARTTTAVSYIAASNTALATMKTSNASQSPWFPMRNGGFDGSQKPSAAKNIAAPAIEFLISAAAVAPMNIPSKTKHQTFRSGAATTHPQYRRTSCCTDASLVRADISWDEKTVKPAEYPMATPRADLNAA